MFSVMQMDNEASQLFTSSYLKVKPIEKLKKKVSVLD